MLLIKSIYQTIKIKQALFFSKFLSGKFDQDKEVLKRLQGRCFAWNNNYPTKVFAIFSINNWETILLDELKKLGDVEHFSWDNIDKFFNSKADWEEFTGKLNKELIAQFDAFYKKNINIIVFFYASDFTISKETINYLKRKNTLLISFCWDDLLYFKGKVKGQTIGVKQMAKLVDINLTMSPEAIKQYNYNGAACYFWKPLKLNEPIETVSYINNSDHFYVLFIGSNYGHRAKFINAIKKTGISVRCFGSGWENAALNYTEMIAEIKKAPVTLGFSNVGYTKNVTTIKGRDFEVPLFGGLYLTQYSVGLDHYYDDQDIFTYKNLKDCINKLNFIKSNPDLALKIRNSGFNKAKQYATWNSRFQYLDTLINTLTNQLSK